MPKIQYLYKTRWVIPSIYPQKLGVILQNMNFSRYYRNRGKYIYGFDPNIIHIDYNDSAQKTPAVRKNVRGMNAPITNNATIIPTGFSSGIVGFSWPDVLQNAVIRCIALLFQEKHFR